jgi:hypothetical protein
VLLVLASTGVFMVLVDRLKVVVLRRLGLV